MTFKKFFVADKIAQYFVWSVQKEDCTTPTKKKKKKKKIESHRVIFTQSEVNIFL